MYKTIGIAALCLTLYGCATWSPEARERVQYSLDQAAKDIANEPTLTNAITNGAGVVALLATTALAEALRRRNKRSDERKASIEADVEKLKNGS